MIPLDAVCDPTLLRAHVDAGTVRERSCGPLVVYNYTPRCVFDGAWDDASLAARGLIVDSRDGSVVARPFPKFFDAAERAAPEIPGGDPIIATKLDGSLGVAYGDVDGSVRLATRGSFDSAQADEANRLWQQRYPHVRLDGDCTPLFEIVYPQNRVVVDYGDRRDLILIAVIDKSTGADLPLDVFSWPGPVAGQRPATAWGDLVSEVSRDDWANREGFVARWPVAGQPDVRLKVKYPTYRLFHAWVTGLTARRAWQIAGVAELTRHGVATKTIARRMRISETEAQRIAAVTPDPVRGAAAQMPEHLRDVFAAEVSAFTQAAESRFARYETLTTEAAHDGDSALPAGRAFAEAAGRVASRHGVSTAPLFSLRRDRRGDAWCAVWAELRPTDADTPLADIDAAADDPPGAGLLW